MYLIVFCEMALWSMINQFFPLLTMLVTGVIKEVRFIQQLVIDANINFDLTVLFALFIERHTLFFARFTQRD